MWSRKKTGKVRKGESDNDGFNEGGSNDGEINKGGTSQCSSLCYPCRGGGGSVSMKSELSSDNVHSKSGVSS